MTTWKPRRYYDESNATPVSIVVREKYAGKRLDKFIADRLDGYSRSFIQKLLKDSKVTVNGAVQKSSYPVETGDTVTIAVPEIKEMELTPQDIRFEILYEDDFLIAINKPAGLTIHPGSGRKDGTLANGLVYHFKKLSDFHEDKTRPGILHRLDKETTGVLLVAKDATVHAAVASQFAEHTIYKEYNTVVDGEMELDSDLIDLPISKDKHDHQKMCIRRDGKEARSTYTVLERFKDFTFVQMVIHTGRTHQIRVHLKAAGYPLIVDDFYGRRKELFLSDITGQAREPNETPLLSRVCLHARRIRFFHPGLQKEMEIAAPLPPDMQSVLDALRKYRPQVKRGAAARR